MISSIISVISTDFSLSTTFIQFKMYTDAYMKKTVISPLGNSQIDRDGKSGGNRESELYNLALILCRNVGTLYHFN